jgi:hypothetical protein
MRQKERELGKDKKKVFENLIFLRQNFPTLAPNASMLFDNC